MTETEHLVASFLELVNDFKEEMRAERACDKFERSLEEFSRLLDSDAETKIERLACRADLFELKFASGAADGSFRGIASMFNEPHETSSFMLPANWKDQIAPGAFTQTLSDHQSRGTRPAMLWQHNPDQPIGAWDRLQETDEGLRAEGRLAIKTAKGAEVYELMKIGGVTGLSIGFKPTKFELNEKAKLRTIREVSLFEISPVSMPADPSARVTDIKGN